MIKGDSMGIEEFVAEYKTVLVMMLSFVLLVGPAIVVRMIIRGSL